MKRIRGAFLGLVVLAVAGPAQAEIMVAPTIEWLADHCPDSGLYTVDRVTIRANKTTTIYLTLIDVLRGDPPKSLVHAVGARSKQKRGDDFLVAFQRYKSSTRRALQAINLTTPATSGYSAVAVTAKLDVLSDGRAILQTFRARLRAKPKVDAVRIGDHSKDNRLELEAGLAAHGAIYGGSTCFLRVPADLLKTAKAARTAKLRAASRRRR